jgi:voltage-gated potassium channel Kch
MAHREARFGYLLAGLIAYLLIGPLAREIFGEMDGLVLMIALSSILVIGIFSLQESRLLFGTGIALAAVAVLLTLLDFFDAKNQILKLIVLGDVFIFFLISIVLAVRHLFSEGPITLNRLMGGMCIYILLGMCWSIIYMYLIWWQPGAFAGAVMDTPDNPVFWDMIYFSFVTLTTLGYGDITPAAPVARALAYTEAIVGQLFIAILIGTLVGNIAGRIKN